VTFSSQYIAELASVLVASDPHIAAHRMLGYLEEHSRAAGGAIFLPVGEAEIDLFVSHSVTLESAYGVRMVWISNRKRLGAGRPVQSPEMVVAPILDDDKLVALLFLDRPQRFDAQAFAVFRIALAKAAMASKAPSASVEGYGRVGRPEDGQRDQLLVLLRENEWNIAKVARVLKVTRRTIYLRLLRYGIQRQRMPKSVKLIRPVTLGS
jgi:hypothetical protein